LNIKDAAKRNLNCFLDCDRSVELVEVPTRAVSPAAIEQIKQHNDGDWKAKDFSSTTPRLHTALRCKKDEAED